mmetsp:Transcript_5782/g.23895  ORF Transcript_5782/g.23895 Transcript_5782/m.23895 type:complete len:547 (-) Transcript_5782:55-1695(-)
MAVAATGIVLVLCTRGIERFDLPGDLLVGVHVVHATLLLRRTRAGLHAHGTLIPKLRRVLHGLGTHVLEALPHAVGEIRDHFYHGSLVLHGATYALGHLEVAALAEVASVGALRHGVEGTHATVLLHAHTVVVEIFPGSLGGTGEHGAAHRHGRSQGERLGDVARVLDASVGDDGNAKLCREVGTLVDRGRLAAAHRAHLLRGADGAGTHADAETIGSGLEEPLRLDLGHDVAANDVELGEVVLEPLDHLNLVDGVTLGGVENDHIQSLCDESLGAVLVRRAGADRGAAQEAALLVQRRSAGGREELLRLDRRAGHQAHELALVVDHRELTLFGREESVLELLDGVGRLAGDEVGSLGHDVLELGGSVHHEVAVAGADQAEELAADDAGVGDDDGGEPTGSGEGVALGEGGVGAANLRSGDVPEPVRLDSLEVGNLLVLGHVVVEEAGAAHGGHGDRHVGFGDGVHGRGDDGGADADITSQFGREVHVGRGEVDVTGVEDDIIVGVADALAEKLGGAEAVDLVEGDIARLALADVPVGEAVHRVRE